MEKMVIEGATPWIRQDGTNLYLVVNSFEAKINSLHDLYACLNPGVPKPSTSGVCGHKNLYGASCIKPAGHKKKHQFVKKTYRNRKAVNAAKAEAGRKGGLARAAKAKGIHGSKKHKGGAPKAGVAPKSTAVRAIIEDHGSLTHKEIAELCRMKGINVDAHYVEALRWRDKRQAEMKKKAKKEVSAQAEA